MNIISVNAQKNPICDNFSCLNIDKNILFKKNQPKVVIENPSVLLSKSINKKNKLKNNGTVLSEECENPIFSFFVNNNNGTYTRKTFKAKSIGVAIEIKRDCNCNTTQKVLAMPINFKGHNFAVTSYSGKTVFMDIGFFSILTYKDNWCYGLPKEPTKYHVCAICNKDYASQTFRTLTKETTFIEYAENKCINGGNHDNLILTEPIVCPVSKGSNYDND